MLPSVDFLKFSFQTENVEPGNIDVSFQTYNEQGKEIWSKMYDLYLPGIKKTMYDPDINKFTDKPFIPWASIIEKADIIFHLIENDGLALYHLPENVDLRHMHSRKTISQDFSAFEFEFKKLYPDFKSKESQTDEFKECIKQIEKVKDNFKDNENIKNSINNLLSNFANPPLKEKLNFAVLEFDKLLRKFLQESDMEKVIKRILLKRNPITHGDAGVVLDVETANSFFYLRLLILAMQLKRIGFNDDEIKISLKNIFGVL